MCLYKRQLAGEQIPQNRQVGQASASHIGRIERGERRPSGDVLRKLSKPLGASEDEIFMVAGYLTVKTDESEKKTEHAVHDRLDPDIAKFLSQEPVAVQRAVIGIVAILKNLAKTT